MGSRIGFLRCIFLDRRRVEGLEGTNTSRAVPDQLSCIRQKPDGPTIRILKGLILKGSQLRSVPSAQELLNCVVVLGNPPSSEVHTER